MGRSPAMSPFLFHPPPDTDLPLPVPIPHRIEHVDLAATNASVLGRNFNESVDLGAKVDLHPASPLFP